MSEKMWGGRFAAGTDSLVEAFTASIQVDSRLYAEDIRGSQAHARMLGRVGVLTASEVEAIVAGLQQVEQEIAEQRLPFVDSLEDIHMHVESRLTEIIGDVGKKAAHGPFPQ
jgi:Argininosuccinate lyase